MPTLGACRGCEMRKFIVWKEEYSVGNQKLDNDHQQIISIINDLYELVLANDSGRGINAIVKRLNSYTQLHFTTEEHMLVMNSYPHLQDHRQEHEAMISRTQCLQLKRSFDKDSCQDVLLMLKEWWLGHIQKRDQDYRPYLKDIETKQGA